MSHTSRLVVALLACLPHVRVAAIAQEAGGNSDLRFQWREGERVGYQFRVIAKKGEARLGTTGMVFYTPRKFEAKEVDAEPRRGSGTGFVVHADGYLVTCAHVVEDATAIEVVLGERTYVGTVVVRDEAHDLALVKIEARGLPTLRLAKSADVELAQEVRAFGFPLTTILGESIKVTRGSVSGIVKRGDDEMFQVDAAINPGNSGGPIVAEDGRVVGVTTSKLTGNDVSKVGFAVPVDDVVRLLEGRKVAFTAAGKGATIDGPSLARGVIPAVALLKVTSDPLVANGKLFALDYTANLSTSEQGTPRGGGLVLAGIGQRSTDRGRIVVNGFGGVVDVGESENLPFLMGSVAAIPFDALPPDGRERWKIENKIAITTTTTKRTGDGNPLGMPRIPRPRFGPIGPIGPFGPGGGFDPRDPFGRPEQPKEEVVSVQPAIERYDYEVVERQGDVVSIRRTYELATLEKAGGLPSLEVTGTGILRFDVKQGLPVDLKFEATLTTREAGEVASLPIEFGFERVDLEALAKQTEEAQQKADADRKQREEMSRAAAVARAELLNGTLGTVPAVAGPVRQLDVGPWNTTALAFSPDGKRLAVGKLDQSLRLVDVASGRELALHPRLNAVGQVKALAFTPDGNLLLCGGATGTILIWNVAGDGTLEELGRFSGHASEIKSLAISANGSRVLSGESRNRVRCWDLLGRRELAAFEFQGGGEGGLDRCRRQDRPRDRR